MATTRARSAYAAVFPGGNPTRGQGSAAAKATEPPTLAKGLAFSTRSRGRSATCVAESSRLPILTSARARLVQRLFPPPERARGCPPAVTAGRPASIGWLRACTSSPAALHCHLLLGARWTLALNPAVGATAHESGDGRKHTRLLGSTRESSTVLVLEAPNKPLAPLPPGCLPDGGHPSPEGASQGTMSICLRLNPAEHPLRYRCSYNPRSP